MEKIIRICSQNDYQFITNFEWYISVLVELTRMEGTSHGPLIASQMMDVAIRVETIRGFAVSQMALLLENYHLLIGSGQSKSSCEVLYAAAWICGEFSSHLDDPKETLQFMFRGRVTSLPGHIQSVYIQNGLKLFSSVTKETLEAEESKEEVVELARFLESKMSDLLLSSDLEVQERASTVLEVNTVLYESTYSVSRLHPISGLRRW